MPDFAEKARHWPKIASVAQLAPRLQNVKPRRYRDYSHTADPPCHDSSSKTSFQFGDHPQGGLIVSCWACIGQGEKGWYDRLENILGVALQIRYSNGKLRYRRPGETAGPDPPPSRLKQPAGPAAIHRREATLADLKKAPMWLAAKGKAPWQGLALDQGRLTAQAYRQSMDDREAPGKDGLRLARYGGAATTLQPSGERKTTRIRPWGSLSEIEEFIAGLKSGREAVSPALALAGSPRMPAPMALLAVDCDYRPAKDPDGAGAEARLRLRTRCAAAGAAVFRSSGGHGFHALFLLAPEADPHRPRQSRTGAPGAPGISAETFLSGSRRMLSLRLDQPLANGGDAVRLPLISAEQADEMIQAAFSE